MNPLAQPVIFALSVLTLLGQILALKLIIILLFRKRISKVKRFKKWIDLFTQNYITAIFVVSAVATIGSLTLSEVLNFNPCKLCWYQRIFMYPIALISFLSLIFNEARIKKFVLALSGIGIAIATYHILMQLFPKAFECSDEVAKCSAVQFAEFGYITIPVMAFTAFLLIILISLIGREK